MELQEVSVADFDANGIVERYRREDLKTQFSYSSQIRRDPQIRQFTSHNLFD